jgi:hypothetical protein
MRKNSELGSEFFHLELLWMRARTKFIDLFVFYLILRAILYKGATLLKT